MKLCARFTTNCVIGGSFESLPSMSAKSFSNCGITVTSRKPVMPSATQRTTTG